VTQSLNAETSGTEERQTSLSDRVLKAFTQPRRHPATQDEEMALANAKREDFVWRGEKLTVWRWGDGTQVLLLHGWESRGSHMAGFVPNILRAGFGVVALDAPAHGDSSGEYTNILDYGRAVVALAQHIGLGSLASPLAGVIAHSAGSAAALYAYAHGLHSHGHKFALLLGSIIYATCGGWFYLHATAEPNYLRAWLPGMLLSGLGVGLLMPALSAAAVTALSPERFGIGSATNTAIRNLGSALGVALTVMLIATEKVSSNHEPFAHVFLLLVIGSLLTSILCLPLRLEKAAIPARSSNQSVI